MLLAVVMANSRCLSAMHMVGSNIPEPTMCHSLANSSTNFEQLGSGFAVLLACEDFQQRENALAVAMTTASLRHTRIATFPGVTNRIIDLKR
ncbi:hypothetical protein ACWKW9_20335 [Rhizobium daejeonense]